MSGGVDSSVTAALLKAEGYDVVGVTLQLYDHGAATHRKGACCAGQDIHDARAVAEPDRHSALRARLREPLQGDGDRSVRRELCRGRDAGAVRPLQHVDQVQGPARRPRAISARACWRPATTSPAGRCRTAAARSTAPAMPSATRAISCSRTTREQLDFLRFPLGDKTKAETRELARRFGLCGRRQARQPGHLLRADRPLHRRRSSGCGRAPPSPATSSISPAACSAATTASSISRSGSGAVSALPPAIRSMWSSSTRRRRRVIVGPREALRTQPHAAARGQLDRRRRARRGAGRRSPRGVREGALDAAAAAGLAAPFRRRRPGSRSSWPAARTGFRPARPASSMTRRTASRGCWAADSSRMWPIRPGPGRWRRRRRVPARRKSGLIGLFRNAKSKKYFMTTPHNPASFVTIPGRTGWNMPAGLSAQRLVRE